MRRLICVLFLVAALTDPLQGAGSALGRAYVSPRRLVLTKRDVPRNFRRVTAREITNAEADRADHLPTGTFVRHGRIASYETSFRYTGRDFGSIADNVIAFRSPGGAHWEFVRSVNKGRKPLAGRDVRPMSVGHIGNEAAGFRYQETVSGASITCGIALFRRGSYAAWVVSCGFTRDYPLAISAKLAGTIDRRIQSAG